VLDFIVRASGCSLDVVEVELVGVEDDLGGVVEEDPVGAVRQLVAHAVLAREVHILRDQLRIGLLLVTVDQLLHWEARSTGHLNLGNGLLLLLLGIFFAIGI
jgi:hypothetical protein